MHNNLFSRSALNLLGFTLLAACGAPEGDSDGASATTGVATATATASADTDAPDTDAPDTDAPTTGGSDPADADCGNGLIEPGEACDGAELGGQQCVDVNPGYLGGTLACGASCTLDASGCVLAPDAALVTLNEVTSVNVLSGPYADKGDAIELHNAGMKAADLSGWRISDDETFPPEKTYLFPNGSTLGPGKFLVLVVQDPDTLEGELPFGLKKSGIETVILLDAGDNVVDSVMVDGAKAAVSLCRLPDAIGAWEQCEQTFGAPNKLAATACGNGKLEEDETCDGPDLGGQTCASLGLGYNAGALACTPKCRFDAKQCTTDSQLVINELESVIDDIELYNASGAAIDLSGWVLTDARVDALYDPNSDSGKLVFAPGTTIGADEYLVLPVGSGPNQHPFGLGASGDTVVLLKLGPITVIDQVTYGPDEALVSFCRQPNGPGGAWTPNCKPTMGGPN